MTDRRAAEREGGRPDPGGKPAAPRRRPPWLLAALGATVIGLLAWTYVRQRAAAAVDVEDLIAGLRAPRAESGDGVLGVADALGECIELRRLLQSRSFRGDEMADAGRLSARLARCTVVLQASPEEALDCLRERANHAPNITPREHAILLATIGGRSAAEELEATFDPDWTLTPGEATRVATVLSELDRLSPRGQTLVRRMTSYHDPLLDGVLRTALNALLTKCDSASADAEFLRAQLAQLGESSQAEPARAK